MQKGGADLGWKMLASWKQLLSVGNNWVLINFLDLFLTLQKLSVSSVPIPHYIASLLCELEQKTGLGATVDRWIVWLQ